MKHILVIIDMQNDFINGSLGTPEAESIVDNVIEAVKNWEGPIIYTKDTHEENYFTTLEGKYIPGHCNRYTEGWKYPEDLYYAIRMHQGPVENLNKSTFGSLSLGTSCVFPNSSYTIKDDDIITICGLCTDICVISNALILRAKYPNNKIQVMADCCAGTTPEKHKMALEVMKSNLIDII